MLPPARCGRMPLFGSPKPDLPLQCPRDQTVMDKLKVESAVVDRCPACKGTWFDQKEIRRVSGDKDIELLATRVRQFAQPSPFACPRCGGGCVASFVEDVEVDTCTLCHGVWMDARELDEAKRQFGAVRDLSNDRQFRSFLSRL
jgi:Zn-finger nucleic acid-binding protein